MLPPPNSFTSEQRRQLLTFARLTIEAAVRKTASPDEPPEFASISGCGVFVSLHIGGHLRGCIGMVESNASLAATLARCARSAALEDRRFPPMEAAELERVAIELSLLSPIQPIPAGEVEPGKHGLLIRKGYFSGLLLPQVATKYKWSRERFLEETCVKAGLPRQAWKDPETKVFGFTAEVF